jgi:hypothetical protein
LVAETLRNVIARLNSMTFISSAMPCFDELKALAGARFARPMNELGAGLDRLDFARAGLHLDEVERLIEAKGA